MAYTKVNMPGLLRPAIDRGLVLQRQHPPAGGHVHRLRPALGAQLRQDCRHVELDGMVADRQPPGDRLVGQPDRDERQWPLNPQGKREDPWRKTIYLPMRTADGEKIVFGPFADTLIRAVNNFIRLCRRSDRGGKDPVVLLGSESFRNTHGGTTHKPTVKIIGWEYWTPGVAASPPKPVLVPITPPATPATAKLASPARKVAGDMDDEIPF